MVYDNGYLVSEKEVDYVLTKLGMEDNKSKTGFNSNYKFSLFRIKGVVDGKSGNLKDLVDELKRVNQ